MARLIECNFNPGDILRHKRKRHRAKLYRYVNRYKNTAWIVDFRPERFEWADDMVKRKVKINTLNFCYEIDKVYQVLYGTKTE